MVFVFPGATARAALDAPEAYSLDTRLFSTPDAVLASASARSDAARLVEIGSHWTFDLAYPLVYGLFLFSTWSYAWSRLAANEAAARRLARSALAAPAFDLIENLAITVLFASAPVATASSAAPALALASPQVSITARVAAMILVVATPSKWICVAIAVAGAIVLPVVAMAKKKPHRNI